MIKAIKKLARTVSGFFEQVIDALFSIPDFFVSVIKLIGSLVDSVINLVAFIFNLFASLGDALDFLGTGLETVTGVLGYMPEPLVALCMATISLLVVRMFLDLL